MVLEMLLVLFYAQLLSTLPFEKYGFIPNSFFPQHEDLGNV